MRHRDLLETIGALRPGEALRIDIMEARDAAEDYLYGAESHHGLRAPIRTHEVLRYTEGLRKYGVKVAIDPLTPAITIHKSQQQQQEPTT